MQEEGAGVEPIHQPIDGVLDLHTFRPSDLGELLPDYLEECQRRGLLQVRIIHGKGIGTLRTTVHTLLGRDPRVLSYALADPAGGGWGATVVHLRPHGGDG
jgi:DNA-nicking Smr family endonuclease